MRLYETLGLSNEATDEEIKQAFRDMAKQHHPDRGGSTEKMSEVNQAYMILSDKDKKKHYDETGETEKPKKSKLEVIASQMFMQIIQSTQLYEHEDIISALRDEVYGVMQNLEQQKKQIASDINKLEKVKARLKTKGNKILVEILDNKIAELNGITENIKSDISMFVDMEKMLDDYQYDYIQQEEVTEYMRFTMPAGTFKI